MWNDLNPIWQTAFTEAWEAFTNGSIPIGAVITDDKDQILIKARNHNNDIFVQPPQIGNTLIAHAEMNALLQLQPKRFSARNYSIFTTCEPCPMCFSTIYMSGIRKIHYAARDFYAGSTNLVGTTPYLSVKPLNIYPPIDQDLELVCVTMMAYFIYQRDPESPSPVLDAWMDEFASLISIVKTETFQSTILSLKQNPEIGNNFDRILTILKDPYGI